MVVNVGGGTVEGDLVEVNDEEIGETNADVRISLIVTYEEELGDEELEIEAVWEELKGELEIDLEQD